MKYTCVIFGLCCSLALTFSKIGLTNPGNLCYLNSVIQSLYHVEDFRQRILALKSVEDLPVANAMKNLFWELTVKAKGNAVTLVRLCDMNPGMQEDAQEFLLRLFEKIGDDLDSDENPANIFAGELTHYIICKTVNVTKERKEMFYDMSIDVADSCDVQEAMDKLFTPDILEGDNQYKTKDHGLQDALKGQSISRLPKVLYIHLKRFEYDIETGNMRKISKAVNFPMNLDLNRYVDVNMKNDIALKENPMFNHSNYELNAIILHHGNGNMGHYTCFARPYDAQHCDIWHRLNDEIFSEVDIDTMIKESVGGNCEIRQNADDFSKNAYILQYIRRENTTKLSSSVQFLPESLGYVRSKGSLKSTTKLHKEAKVTTRISRNFVAAGLALHYWKKTVYKEAMRNR